MNRVTLADVMNRDFVGVSESDDITAAARTMRDAGEHTAVVLRGSEPVGVVTAADVLDHFVSEDRNGETVADAMTPTPPSLRPEADVDDATTALSRTDTHTVLVANGDGVQGLVTARDIATVPREPTDTESPAVVGGDAGSGTANTSAGVGKETDSYSAQSICEACGSLARDLANVNGQLLCPDCKDV